MRLVLTSEERWTQQHVAQALRVSQSLVAGVIGRAKQSGWLTATGIATVSGLSAWVENYPGPGGLVLPVYGRAPLEGQIARVASDQPNIVVSGLLAANQIAAWAPSRRGTVYVRSFPNIPELDLVEADSAADATMLIHQPADLSIFTCARSSSGGNHAWADLLQVAADLEVELEPDRRTASDARIALWQSIS